MRTRKLTQVPLLAGHPNSDHAELPLLYRIRAGLTRNTHVANALAIATGRLLGREQLPLVRTAVAGFRFDLRVRHVFRDSRLPSASHAIEHTGETIYQTLGELDT